ncbi:MAG: hypothetical protein ACI9NC_003160, partial [Verrucomicrobiales bacterium]
TELDYKVGVASVLHGNESWHLHCLASFRKPFVEAGGGDQ